MLLGFRFPPKIFTLPEVVRHLNAIREMVKNSATDKRSMSKMEDASFDLDKLVSSMAFRKDPHECKVRSVQNTVRELKPIVQRVRGLEANKSSHFKDAHVSELQAFHAKCASTLVALRGVQVKQFYRAFVSISSVWNVSRFVRFVSSSTHRCCHGSTAVLKQVRRPSRTPIPSAMRPPLQMDL